LSGDPSQDGGEAARVPGRGELDLRRGIGRHDLDGTEVGQLAGLPGEGQSRVVGGRRSGEDAVEIEDEAPGRRSGAGLERLGLDHLPGRAVLEDEDVRGRDRAERLALGRLDDDADLPDLDLTLEGLGLVLGLGLLAIPDRRLGREVATGDEEQKKRRREKRAERVHGRHLHGPILHLRE